jgi:hypothetical protein
MRYVKPDITKLVRLTLLLALGILASGCRPETPVFPAPSIRFDVEGGRLFHDTTLVLGDSVRIGILAETGSDQELTHLHTTILKDTLHTAIDTALFTNSLVYTRKIIKGAAGRETWSFYVRDREGRKSSEISVTLTLDSASVYGDVRYIPSLTLGAQNHPSNGSFCSLPDGRVFSTAEAFNNQRLINLAYYFDRLESDQNTIASPGANIDESTFPGPQGLAAWTVRNTTRFEYLESVSTAEFDRCRNDSLILANTFEFESGKRKAKNLQNGQIYAFVTDKGLKGLFRVISVEGGDTGTIRISMKEALK